MITETEMKAKAWDNMMEYFSREGKCVSLREARKIVGGAAHLDMLLGCGKVREVEGGDAANSKRRFLASDVYSNMRRVSRARI